MDNAQPEFVYRLATPDEWRTAQETGFAPLREIDRKDGYVHLSTKEQALETARLHFVNVDELLALEIRLSNIADRVKFELAPKRGEKFPHLYSDLRAAHIVRAIRLERDGEGFVFGGNL